MFTAWGWQSGAAEELPHKAHIGGNGGLTVTFLLHPAGHVIYTGNYFLG
jgi:hypothetical protein